MSTGSLGFAWVHSGAPGDRQVHLGSRGITWGRLDSSDSLGVACVTLGGGASCGRVH